MNCSSMSKYAQYESKGPKGKKQPLWNSLTQTWDDISGGFGEGWAHPNFRDKDWERFDAHMIPMEQWLQKHPRSSKRDYLKWKNQRPGRGWMSSLLRRLK